MKEHPHHPQFIEDPRAMLDDVDYTPKSREVTRAYLRGEISTELFHRSMERSTHILQENLKVRPVEDRSKQETQGLKKILHKIFG